jgi:hypothetical protein
MENKENIFPKNSANTFLVEGNSKKPVSKKIEKSGYEKQIFLKENSNSNSKVYI